MPEERTPQSPPSVSNPTKTNGNIPQTPPELSTTSSPKPPAGAQPEPLPYNNNNSININDNEKDLPSTIAEIHHRVRSFLSESHPPDSLLAAVQRQTRTSLDVVKAALARYRLSELSLSYNGGKDCLVLLLLFLAGLHEFYYHGPESGKKKPQEEKEEKEEGNNDDDTNKTTLPVSSIPAIYALPPDPFPDVEYFVESSSRAYHLSVTRYTTDPPRTTMKTCFANYLSLNPGIRAIFVGTRRTDPHGEKLTHFDPTDHGWPDFMRIHPVIDWHYAEIWAFIRHLRFEYCPLYDRGYTSLGGQHDTHPNPKLRLGSDTTPQEPEKKTNGQPPAQQYRPAYELMEDLEERLGRG